MALNYRTPQHGDRSKEGHRIAVLSAALPVIALFVSGVLIMSVPNKKPDGAANWDKLTVVYGSTAGIVISSTLGVVIDFCALVKLGAKASLIVALLLNVLVMTTTLVIAAMAW